MIIINWPVVLVNTVILYALIIITLPFSAAWATIFLFCLIAFWSRLPGVGMPIHYLIIYATDLVDFFSLIIAINLGGPIGAVFSVYANVMSRVAGVFPGWQLTMEDVIGQVVACMLIPFFHGALGSDIFVSMVAYSVIRIVVVLPMNFITSGYGPIQYIIEATIAISALILVNSLYARFLGGFFDALLQKGVQFSWILFLLATAIIVIFYISVFGTSKSPKSFSMKKIVKHRIQKSKEKKREQQKDTHELDEMKKIKDML